MNEDLNKPVQAEEGSGVSEEPKMETPKDSQSGVPEQGTPDKAAPDVDRLIAKYENDIRQMKSSLQKREAQVSAEWEQRYSDLQSQLHEARMSKMTDEERKSYEAQLQSEEMLRLQQQVEELNQERAQFSSMMEGMNFFLSEGVPADKLVLNEGYEAMVNSGWAYLRGELTRLRELSRNPQPQPDPEPKPLKEAPPVVNDKGTPATGTTWAALKKQFGSDEAVYRAVEEGRLDPSIIPSE